MKRHRHEFQKASGSREMVEDEDGDWVRYDEVQDELQPLREDLARYENGRVILGIELRAAREERDRLRELLNTPHTHDFIEAVRLEMPHQRERWGAAHDAGKTPADWFWLVGYLAGKALHALVSGNIEKAKHHVITSAAALGNWFLAITGESTSMRPGIAPPEEVSGG